MKVVVVVQARTGSTRLPGKVLLPLAGAPLLQRLVERVRTAGTPFEIVVATTTQPEDDAIRNLCQRMGIACFSGHATDVLDRHYHAAVEASADVVVKIPSDCPLIDPDVIDSVLAFFLRASGDLDFVSNLHPATWPDGNDVEVMTFGALEAAWKEARRPFEREHTTPFLWERPERFRLGNVAWERDLSMTHRFTLDYAEDYAFVVAVFAALWTPSRPLFGLDEILALLEARPEVLSLNRRYAGVNWYRHHMDELRTIRPSETRSLEEVQ